MTIKKSFNPIPTLPSVLLVAASLTIAACSKEESTSQQEQKAESAVSQTQPMQQPQQSQQAQQMMSEPEAMMMEESVPAASTTMERADTAAMEMAAAEGSAEMDLAKKSGCLVCHAVDKKVVGPSLRDIATKYRGQGDAKATLINSISKGSSGKWGAVAMPANSPKVSDADIAKLAEFILTIK